MDELTKLIEDEVIADQQPNVGLGQTAMVIDEDQLRKLQREGSWPEGVPPVEGKNQIKVITISFSQIFGQIH